MPHMYVDWALVQVMVCRLFGTKPIPGPTLNCCQLDPWEQISVTFLFEILTFSFKKLCSEMSSARWWPFCSGGDELKETCHPSDTSVTADGSSQSGSGEIVTKVIFNVYRPLLWVDNAISNHNNESSVSRFWTNHKLYHQTKTLNISDNI